MHGRTNTKQKEIRKGLGKDLKKTAALKKKPISKSLILYFKYCHVSTEKHEAADVLSRYEVTLFGGGEADPRSVVVLV